jgi:hypothetical protein
MKTIRSAVLLAALSAAAGFANAPAAALPLGPAAGGIGLVAQLDRASPTIQVGRRGGAVAAGIIGGMILGGIIASQRPYYYYGEPPYGYYPPYPVYQPYPMYRPYPYDPAVAYCMRRFKSYDPYSMTYLGYDGLRHPCP